MKVRTTGAHAFKLTKRDQREVRHCPRCDLPEYSGEIIRFRGEDYCRVCFERVHLPPLDEYELTLVRSCMGHYVVPDRQAKGRGSQKVIEWHEWEREDDGWAREFNRELTAAMEREGIPWGRQPVYLVSEAKRCGK